MGQLPIPEPSTISSRGFVAERMWVMRLIAARLLPAHVACEHDIQCHPFGGVAPHRRVLHVRQGGYHSRDVSIAEEIRKSNSARIERFIYYLDRHIESTPTTMVRWRSRWLRPYVATAPSNSARPRRLRSPPMRSRVQFWDSVVAMIHQQRFDATG